MLWKCKYSLDGGLTYQELEPVEANTYSAAYIKCLMYLPARCAIGTEDCGIVELTPLVQDVVASEGPTDPKI